MSALFSGTFSSRKMLIIGYSLSSNIGIFLLLLLYLLLLALPDVVQLTGLSL